MKKMEYPLGCKKSFSFQDWGKISIKSNLNKGDHPFWLETKSKSDQMNSKSGVR